MLQASKRIKVLIVDDSAFIRKAIEMMLREEPDIEVVGLAKNGLEGVELASKLHPDVITMDVEMPIMDGLTALKTIMGENPTPVIMISSLTEEGADTTLKALELGAVDFIPKSIDFSTTEIIKIKSELVEKIRNSSKIKIRNGIFQSNKVESSFSSRLTEKIKEKEIHSVRGGTTRTAQYKLIAIASSTGGPMTLQKIIPALPNPLPVPVVIAQHMPAIFTKSFANRLNALCPFEVLEVEHGMEMEPGKVYLGKGAHHLKITKAFDKYIFHLVEHVEGYLYKPSGDLLFESATKWFNGHMIGIVLTGMGKDGAEGLLKVKENGGYTIAQDEKTSVIYGMPKAAAEIGAAKAILPLDKIPDKIALLLFNSSN